MKKQFTLISALMLVAGSGMAQFSDDFESYTVGSYLGLSSGPWTTWSGTQGGTEDVQITSASAASGTKSIYFSTTSANGGPQDVVLNFGGAHNTGTFTFSSNIFVQSGKGGYYNFQANTTIGQVWALDVYMISNGNLILSNQDQTFLTTTYPNNQWFNLKFEIDLSTNVWEVFIDNVSVGSFANTQNQIASIDIFPVHPTALGGNNNAGYYIDDVYYNHVPYTLPALNGAVTLVTTDGGLAGQTTNVNAKVRNLGTTPITSFDLTYDYNGTPITQNITGVNIASLAYYDVTFTTPITLLSGMNNLTVTISNVNGNASDDDANDDDKSITTDPVTPAPGKMVVAEEGTGTWCGWCPRGAVFMDEMQTKYAGYFAGIAVHNADPMVVTDYDAAVGGLISGYPGALVDRLPYIDPSAIENDFMTRIVIAPAATFNISGSLNSSNNMLDVYVETDFQQTVTGSYKLAVVLTEDDVTGTTSQYNQSNYYSGGSNGVMGGFETLSNPVPAAQMHYDHVARDINPSFAGQSGLFPGTINSGQTFNNTFTFTIDPAWETSQMHIVALLIAPDGKIDNAGMVDFTSSVGLPEEASAFGLNIYPNPAAEMTNVKIGLTEAAVVSMEIIDINGRVVATRNYGMLNGEMILPVNTADLASGIYMVNVRVGDHTESRRLIVQ
jgi:thiol-disulfide isomerase/thioredoxin